MMHNNLFRFKALFIFLLAPILWIQHTHSMALKNHVKKIYKGQIPFNNQVLNASEIASEIDNAEQRLKDKSEHPEWPKTKKYLKGSSWLSFGSLAMYAGYWLHSTSDEPSSIGTCSMLVGLASCGWGIKRIFDGFRFESKIETYRDRLEDLKKKLQQTVVPSNAPSTSRPSHRRRRKKQLNMALNVSSNDERS